MLRCKITIFFIIYVLCASLYAEAQNVKISNIQPINLGIFDPGPANDFTTLLEYTLCAYRDDGNGNYRITITGNNDVGDNFFMADGFGNTIRYQIHFQRATAPGWRNMLAGQSFDFNQADTASDSCAGGDTAKIRARVRDNWGRGRPSGTYTDTLTIVMEPR